MKIQFSGMIPCAFSSTHTDAHDELRDKLNRFAANNAEKAISIGESAEVGDLSIFFINSGNRRNIQAADYEVAQLLKDTFASQTQVHIFEPVTFSDRLEISKRLSSQKSLNYALLGRLEFTPANNHILALKAQVLTLTEQLQTLQSQFQQFQETLKAPSSD